MIDLILDLIKNKKYKIEEEENIKLKLLKNDKNIKE